jgi:hypothetical protein
MRVSEVNMIPETRVWVVGRWSRAGGASDSRSQWRMDEPGKCLYGSALVEVMCRIADIGRED